MMDENLSVENRRKHIISRDNNMCKYLRGRSLALLRNQKTVEGRLRKQKGRWHDREPEIWEVDRSHVALQVMKNTGFHANQNSEPLKDFKQHQGFFFPAVVDTFQLQAKLFGQPQRKSSSGLLRKTVHLTAGEPNRDHRPVWFPMDWPTFKSLNQLLANIWISRISGKGEYQTVLGWHFS